MKLGFIGTGVITEAFITGMLKVGEYDNDVLVSLRSSERSSQLANQFSNVTVVAENQEIVDQSDWVFIAVLPSQARSLLESLNFSQEQKVISIVAGVELAELSDLCHPAKNVFRIIPLPPVEFGLGPMPLSPPDEAIEKFLQRFSVPVPVESEREFSSFSAASAVMASHYEIMATVATWIHLQDVPQTAAAGYTTAIFEGLAGMASRCDWDSLQALPDNSQTPGGLNEQVIRELGKSGWFNQISEQLDGIARRLSKAE